MNRLATQMDDLSGSLGRWRRLWPGLLLAAALATAALMLAQTQALRASGLGVMTLAIVLGIAMGNLGNLDSDRWAAPCAPGIDLARSRLLRLGIVCYGARLTYQEVSEVGWAGVLLALCVMLCTLALALWLGRRLGLERESALLIGAGSAICGVAAVMATQSLARARESEVAIAVSTVVLFGTLAMLIYPWLYAVLPMSAHEFGLYAGATIHEVAQVVVVGEQVGGAAAGAAVIEKMLRVMMLAPFLLLLPWTGLLKPQAPGARVAAGVPWFALGFLAMIAVNSLGFLPQSWRSGLRLADSILLTMAMAAIGLRTHLVDLWRSGSKPLQLAGALFLFLIAGGAAIHQTVLALLG